MGWNIFKKKEKEPSLEERVELALQKAKQDKRTAEKEIKDIKEWMADAILDVYSPYFPNANLTYYRKQYAETAVTDYEKTKEKYSGELETELVEKCDRIISGYKNQIKLRESKLALFEKLEQEYKKTKEKLRLAEKQGERTTGLQEHTERLKNLDDDSESLSTAMTETYKLEDLKDDIAEKEEYFNQLEKLNLQFSDETDFNTSLAYKDEIDKMVDKLK